MSPKLNRRELLVAGGAVGAAAAAVSALAPASPGRSRAGPVHQAPGRPGQDDRRAGGGRRACCQGVRCVFGIPGAQNNELWDAFKARGVPYLLVAHEASASVMADASARVTGEVGVFSVVPGPGLTNALTGIGEALFDSIPVVGIVTDIDRSPQGADRPGPRARQRGDPPAGRQASDRSPPPGRDSRALFQAFSPPGPASRDRSPS